MYFDDQAMEPLRRDLRLTRAVFFALAAAAIVHLAWMRGHLPDIVASHFDAGGEADGWMPRDAFLLLLAAVDLLMIAMFAAIPRLVRMLPVSMINLPRREYWLAPERRAAALISIAVWMYRLGSLTLLFMLGTAQHILWKNVADRPGLGTWFWVLFGSYLLLTALMVGLMLRSYSRVPDDGEAGAAR